MLWWLIGEVVSSFVVVDAVDAVDAVVIVVGSDDGGDDDRCCRFCCIYCLMVMVLLLSVLPVAEIAMDAGGEARVISNWLVDCGGDQGLAVRVSVVIVTACAVFLFFNRSSHHIREGVKHNLRITSLKHIQKHKAKTHQNAVEITNRIPETNPRNTPPKHTPFSLSTMIGMRNKTEAPMLWFPNSHRLGV